MTDREIQILIDYAEGILAKGITKEEGLRYLQEAGILDKDGNHTPPYQNFAKALIDINMQS